MNAAFSDPKEVVLQMGLRAGMKVGDFGAGTGHYSRAAAAIVAPGGKVYAIDVQEDVLKHLKLNTHERHQGAIETVWGDIERLGGTHLKDASLDAAIVANVLFQLDDRAGLIAELKRTLRPDGRLLVVDWAGSYGGLGPVPEAVVSEQEAETLFIGGGFYKEKAMRAGPHHYGLVFTKPGTA